MKRRVCISCGQLAVINGFAESICKFPPELACHACLALERTRILLTGQKLPFNPLSKKYHTSRKLN